MKFKQIIILTFLLTSLNFIQLNAQNQETTKIENRDFLKGLTKANGSDLSKKEIKFDGESFPIYTAEGIRIKGIELSNAMNSGNYFPEFYLDRDNEIRAAILEKLSKKDKKARDRSNDSWAKEKKLIEKMLGSEAPAFVAKDMNGNIFSLNDLKGKVIVINFWFIQCEPCVMEIPELNKLVEKYENVIFLGFAVNNKNKLESFLKKTDFFYSIIPNGGKVAAKYNVMAYPAHIIIDKNSKIQYYSIGLGSKTIDNIEKNIDTLIE